MLIIKGLPIYVGYICAFIEKEAEKQTATQE